MAVRTALRELVDQVDAQDMTPEHWQLAAAVALAMAPVLVALSGVLRLL